MKTKKTQTKPTDPRLPEGYDGPAFQLEDGRVLYVEQYLGRVWATVYLQDGVSHFYQSAATSQDYASEGHARKALIAYAASKGLQTYRP